jgi:hypothetical protein
MEAGYDVAEKMSSKNKFLKKNLKIVAGNARSYLVLGSETRFLDLCLFLYFQNSF